MAFVLGPGGEQYPVNPAQIATPEQIAYVGQLLGNPQLVNLGFNNVFKSPDIPGFVNPRTGNPSNIGIIARNIERLGPELAMQMLEDEGWVIANTPQGMENRTPTGATAQYRAQQQVPAPAPTSAQAWKMTAGPVPQASSFLPVPSGSGGGGTNPMSLIGNLLSGLFGGGGTPQGGITGGQQGAFAMGYSNPQGGEHAPVVGDEQRLQSQFDEEMLRRNNLFGQFIPRR